MYHSNAAPLKDGDEVVRAIDAFLIDAGSLMGATKSWTSRIYIAFPLETISPSPIAYPGVDRKSLARPYSIRHDEQWLTLATGRLLSKASFHWREYPL